jgi:hypothetical protein
MPSPAAITSLCAEADGVAEEMAHGAARRLDRRLTAVGRVEPKWRQISAMGAADPAVEIGDGCDHRRPGLGRRVSIGPIVAARMET